MRLVTLTTSAVLCIALAACGGGGSSGGSGPSTTPPTTNPGGGGGGGGSTNPPSTPQQAQVGGATAFVTSSQMTLYLFGLDTANHSNCPASNGCSAVWVPYTAPAGTTAPSGFTLTTRSDGTLQWTFNGWPLYTYVGDTAPGQNNGNGLNQFGGLWQTARPNANGAGGGGGGGGGGNPY